MTREEIADLNFLDCLRAAGVENWDGYDYALELFKGLDLDEDSTETI